MDDKSLVRAFSHRQRYARQAVRITTACTGEMRVTLAFRAVVGQLEMPRSFLHKRFVNQSDFQQAFERPVDRYLVEASFVRPKGNLALIERLVGLQ